MECYRRSHRHLGSHLVGKHVGSERRMGIGSEWAAVFAMVFVFIVGFLMGALTVYVCSPRTMVQDKRTPLER